MVAICIRRLLPAPLYLRNYQLTLRPDTPNSIVIPPGSDSFHAISYLTSISVRDVTRSHGREDGATPS